MLGWVGPGLAWALGPDAGSWASLRPSATSDPGLCMSTRSGAWEPLGVPHSHGVCEPGLAEAAGRE